MVIQNARKRYFILNCLNVEVMKYLVNNISKSVILNMVKVQI